MEKSENQPNSPKENEKSEDSKISQKKMGKSGNQRDSRNIQNKYGNTSCKYNPEPIHSKTAKESECSVYFQLYSNHLHQASYRMAEYWQIKKGVGLLAGTYEAIHGAPMLLSCAKPYHSVHLSVCP
jgi:hypothetical protein